MLVWMTNDQVVMVFLDEGLMWGFLNIMYGGSICDGPLKLTFLGLAVNRFLFVWSTNGVEFESSVVLSCGGLNGAIDDCRVCRV